MSASRQPNRELGEVADLAIDRDGAAVLLRYDLVADRQLRKSVFVGREPGQGYCKCRSWNARLERCELGIDISLKLSQAR
jgi:hypothetical protein